MTDRDWQHVIDINLSGAFFSAQAALDHMLERGTGRIINVSSVIGEIGNIGQANYAASKSGLFGLTKTLARETLFHLNKARPAARRRHRAHRERGNPGFIATDMLATIPDRVLDRFAARSRWAGWASPRRSHGWSASWPGRLVLHHRPDLGGQRRPGHVRTEEPWKTSAKLLSCPERGPRSASMGEAWPRFRRATWRRPWCGRR